MLLVFIRRAALGCSLEVPQRGASSEYLLCLHGEIRKIQCGYPLISCYE